MSRIFMRVVVRNESNATIRLRQDWTSQDWTPGGWLPSDCAVTPPGATLQWQAEGDAALGQALTGVEARAWYDVVDAHGAVLGELYIFVNSPWLESQYGNTFHVHAPKGFYASYMDARGQKTADNRAVLEISFRNSRLVRVPDFRPSINGLRFPNGGWREDLPAMTVGMLWNELRARIGGPLADALGIGAVDNDWLPVTRAAQGMCGGMVYTAMDYFHARHFPPEVPVPPASADDPLFQHIRRRLLDSFDIAGKGHRWLSYSSPLYPDDDEGPLQTAGIAKGKAWVSYREEWPRIRELLDGGRLVPLALVQTDSLDIGKNHQVLAYAYQQDGQVARLWLYDPNTPAGTPPPAAPDDLFLEFDITDASNGITVTRHNCELEDLEKKIFAFFICDNYVPMQAPGGVLMTPPVPKAVRLELATGRSVTTGGEATKEKVNACGDVLKYGHWVCMSTVSYVAQIHGYREPVVSWKVAGIDVAAGDSVVQVHWEGRNHALDVHLQPGGRVLQLASRPGDSYQVALTLRVVEAGVAPEERSAEWTVSGSHDGWRFEDIRAEALCIKRHIPSPADWGKFIAPDPQPEPDPRWDMQAWKQDRLRVLEADPSLGQVQRAAIQHFVTGQVETPELQGLARELVSFRLHRPGP